MGLPLPTDVRCFGGGGAGNVSAWDNINIVLVPPPCVADVDDGSGTGAQDGGVGIEDLLYYLARYVAGC